MDGTEKKESKMNPEVYRKVVFDWNQTATDYPRDKCAHWLFEEIAAEYPDYIAVVEGKNSLTYHELNRKANQLAHLLIETGVSLESPVGLLLDRSINMILGMLAATKAGGCHLPMDPACPEVRHTNIHDDAGVAFVLSCDELRERAEKLPGPMRILNEDFFAELEKYPDTNPETEITAENLAYVLFTSGSTGRPKGAEIEHRSLVNLLFWHKRDFGCPPGTRASQCVRPGFDPSVWEIWGALCAGYEMHIVPPDVLIMPEVLHKWLYDNKIEECFLPTPIGDLQLEQEWTEGSSMKFLGCGGDRLQKYPPPGFPNTFINYYGPAECTVIATAAYYSALKPDEPKPLNYPHIGKPVCNTQIYILDKELNPVPPGVPGEIYIGGDCVGRGYRNRPDLTAKSFIKNPLPDTPGDRLYKTGDLAKFLPDGNIEFIGRVDFQVKIRGMRIELEEIQVVMGRHPAVSQTMVMAFDDHGGGKFLAGYVTLHKDQYATPEEIKAFMLEHLPDYMVPRTITVLSAMPLTANGKIDRRQLPVPELTAGSADSEPPETEMEKNIAGIWKEVLGFDPGRNDDFFKLGGHSLKAAQIVTRVNRDLKYRLTLHDFLDHPTVAGLAKQIEGCQQHPLGEGPPQKIEPAPGNDGRFPVSYSQEALWYMSQLKSDRTDYNIVLHVSITGELNTGALFESLKQLVNRHECFRTVILSALGKPYQRILPELEWEMPEHDLSELPEPERESRLDGIIREQGEKVLPMDKAPLFRIDLINLSPGNWVLLMVIHHAIFDGWSVGIFFQELQETYRAMLENREPVLSPVEIDYTDVTVWQRTYCNQETLPGQISYWMGKLLPQPEVLELPMKGPRPSKPKHRGNRHYWRISDTQAGKLKEVGMLERASVFTTVTALLQILLYRYTGTEDVTVATPYACRNNSQLEAVVGYLTNMLVLRGNLAGNPSFREFLQQMRTTCLEAIDNSDVHFEIILGEMEKQETRREPLFNVMIVYQNFPMPNPEAAGIRMIPKEIGNHTAKLDLLFTVEELPNGELECWFEYDADLFEHEAIVKMSEHFMTLVQAVSIDPAVEIGRLDLITPVERQQVLIDWNRTDADYPLDKTYPELFAAQVEKQPGKVAVIAGEIEFTYHELDRRANQLANFLKNAGIGPDVLVGICLERSPELPVALLGILKAGGAYLPLDPKYPSDRLQYMLEDSGTPVLLTTSALRDELYAKEDIKNVLDNLKVVCFDTDAEEIAGCAETAPETTAGPDNLVYVIYTSGSTGKPKGVQLMHRNLINHNYAVIDEFGLSGNDRVLQFGSISFDLSVEEIFPTWLAGATLVLRSEEAVSSLPAFFEFAEKYQLSVLDLPTAFWHEVVAVLDERKLPESVRLVIIGGEKASAERYREWQKHVGGKVRLLNTYGPTETTVISTLSEAAGDGESGVEFPIGRPIANTKVYVLDKNLQPVPVGVDGELYIGGAGVARGYLNQPEKTAEVFVNDPFSSGSGAKMYKTGDLVRWRPDGSLEYQGRVDFQVKLRGHRIELGEIESVLEQYPDIQDGVVTAYDDDNGVKRLAAYYIPKKSGEVSPETLREYLSESLPEYMVPASYMAMETFPMTPGGKINRRGLPEPETAVSDTDYEEPQTAGEILLCNIIKEITGIDKVGLNDNFFALGGDSLLSMQLIDRVRTAGLELKIEQVMQHKTIRDLAKTMESNFETGENATAEQLMVQLQKGEEGETPLFLVHPPSGFLMCYANIVNKLPAQQPVYGFQSMGLIDPDRIQTSVEEITECYLKELLKFQPEGPYLLGGWCFGGLVSYEMARRLKEMGKTVAGVLLIDTPMPKPEGFWNKSRFVLDKVLTMLTMSPRQQFSYYRAKIRDAIYGPMDKNLDDIEGKIMNAKSAVASVFDRGKVWYTNVYAYYRFRVKAFHGNVVLYMCKELYKDMINSPSFGWKILNPDINIVRVPGDHDTMIVPPNSDVLSEEIVKSIAKVNKETSSLD